MQMISTHTTRLPSLRDGTVSGAVSFACGRQHLASSMRPEALNSLDVLVRHSRPYQSVEGQHSKYKTFVSQGMDLRGRSELTAVHSKRLFGSDLIQYSSDKLVEIVCHNYQIRVWLRSSHI